MSASKSKLCSLEIDLDDPDGVYRPGDEITGTVIVDVHRSCTCRGVTIHCRRRVGKSVNEETTDVTTMELLNTEETRWSEGDLEHFQFSLSAPDELFSYEGELFDIVWSLVATADVGWTHLPAFSTIELPTSQVQRPVMDVDDKRDLVSTSDDQALLEVSTRYPKRWSQPGDVFSLALGMFAIAFTSFVSMVGAIAYSTAVVGLVGLYMAQKIRIRRLFEDAVTVELRPTDSTSNNGVIFEFQFDPPRANSIRDIEVRFSGYEEMTTHGWSQESTHRHELASARHLVGESIRRKLGADESIEFATTFEIPGDAPPSLQLRHCRIGWEIELGFQFDHYPDLTATLPIPDDF